MFDVLKLEYVLKSHGITKQDVIEAEGWGSSTYYRKMQADSEWTIGEANELIGLGVELTEIIDIFF